MIDFQKAITANKDIMTLPILSIFAELNPGVIPSQYKVFLKEKLDIGSLTYEIASEAFPEASVVIYEENSCDTDYDDELDAPYKDLLIYCKDWCMMISNKVVKIVYDVMRADPEKIYKRALESFKKSPLSNGQSVYIVSCGNGAFWSAKTKLSKMDINLSDQYNDDIVSMYETLKSSLETRLSGLYILHGVPGAGKTSFIRYLTATVNKKFVILPQSVAMNITDPGFTDFLLDEKDSIFILEDCESIIKDREDSSSPISAVASLLNMTDGLLSDVFNIKFICTFNSSILNIDKALLRKGRCIVNYEFKPLCEEKSKALLKKLGHDSSLCTGPMTLADIYNFNDIDNQVKKKKIGF